MVLIATTEQGKENPSIRFFIQDDDELTQLKKDIEDITSKNNLMPQCGTNQNGAKRQHLTVFAFLHDQLLGHGFYSVYILAISL